VPPWQALVLEPGHRPTTEPLPRGQIMRSFAEGAEALVEYLSTAVPGRAGLAGEGLTELVGALGASVDPAWLDAVPL
jgi:hypothetical protein